MFSALHPPLVQGRCRVSSPSFSDGAGMLGMPLICFQGTFPHGTANEQEHFPLPCNKAGALPPRGLPGVVGSWLQRGAVSLVARPLVGDGWCQLASHPGNSTAERCCHYPMNESGFLQLAPILASKGFALCGESDQ